jgi:hypothetical protein
MTRLAKTLAVLPTLSTVDLGKLWVEAGPGQAPSVPPALLRRLLAQRLQEKRHGGLPLMVVRELERVAEPSTTVPVLVRKSAELTPGTRLIREWNGKTIAVEVREGDFVWEDRTYRSLSEIASEVTGAHWSGPRFFGLHRRG